LDIVLLCKSALLNPNYKFFGSFLVVSNCPMMSIETLFSLKKSIKEASQATFYIKDLNIVTYRD
jgi:hypothetical protein